MQYEQDAANMVMTQTALLAIEGTKMLLTLSGKGAVRSAAILSAVVREQHKSRGAARLKSLLRSGSMLEIFTISQEQLKDWVQAARQYGVLYTVVKDKIDDGMIDLYVRAEDAPRVNRMVERHKIVLTPAATAKAEPAPEQTLAPEQTEIKPAAGAVQIATEMDTDQLIDQILAAPEPVKDDTAAIIDEMFAGDPPEEEFDALFQEEKMPPDIDEPRDVTDPPKALSDPPSGTPSGMSLPDGSEPSEPSKPSSNLQGNEWTAKRVREEWPLYYPREEFTDDQRFEIYKGFGSGLDPEQVKVYADPCFTPEQMEQLRLGLEGGLSISQVKAYAKPEMDENTMSILRQATRPSVKEAISRVRAGQTAEQAGKQVEQVLTRAVKTGKEL